jgi:hypothetical protein
MGVPRIAKIGILVLTLSARAMAKRKDDNVAMLDFEMVEGLVIVRVETSSGSLRLLADTGSNATTLDNISPPRTLAIRVKSRSISVKPYPTQSPVFAQFNATVPKEQRLDGVLGEDFFSQFSSVTFDYAHHRLVLTK